MSILCELRRLMRQPTKLEQKKGPVKDIQPLSMKMTVNELKNRLSSIRMLCTGSGEKCWRELPASRMKLHVSSDFLISTKRSLNGYLDSTDVGG